jgi:tetratricopeptide (TPR) repeat protein
MELYSGIASSALRKYDDALGITPPPKSSPAQPTPNGWITFYFHLGSTYERKQDYSQAEKYFSKCLNSLRNSAGLELLRLHTPTWHPPGESPCHD